MSGWWRCPIERGTLAGFPFLRYLRAAPAPISHSAHTGRRGVSRAACVPSSWMRPRWSTRIRSALWIVDRRWAIVSVVSSGHEPRHCLPDHSLGLGVDAGSRLVQHEDCGIDTRALARWPTADARRARDWRRAPRAWRRDHRAARCTSVAALAVCSARASSGALVASPSSERLAAIVPVNRIGSWKTTPTCRRSRPRSHSRTSMPSTSTRPRVTSQVRLQQPHAGRLLLAGRPDQRDVLARRDGEAAIGHHPPLVRVREPHVLESGAAGTGVATLRGAGGGTITGARSSRPIDALGPRPWPPASPCTWRRGRGWAGRSGWCTG